ncbi:MAG: RDD family protein [Mariprofundaceae bacterium]|nr:RDD family protein [Mariprofundaceae bacterium]
MAEAVRSKARKAGVLIRLFAAGYDLLILFSVCMVAVGIPITISAELFAAHPPQWLQYALFMAVSYAYLVGFWFKAGATTGMRPWKLRLAMTGSGDPISLMAATIRFFGLMITWLAMGTTLLNPFGHHTGDPELIVAAALPALSLLCMILTPNRQALHDLISGTGVYRIEA